MAKRATTPGTRDDRYVAIIQTLTARRKELGLTQTEVAQRLGLHKQWVSRVELGERRLDVVELADFARALDLSPAELAGSIPARV